MPEGDSIHNLASSLRPRLVGRVVRAFAANDIVDVVGETLVGRTVVAVDARGKNLLIRFDDGRALHVHLRMFGRLGFERPRSSFYRPRRAPHQLRIEVDAAVVVGDRIPVLRILKSGGEERAPDLAGLGPDLLDPRLDIDACVARLRGLAERPIGEALLVQRALAGIGNIYKSETLFLERVHPLSRVRDLDDETLRRVVRRASDLLRMNLGDLRRRTRSSLAGPRTWVYARRGRVCLRCRTAVDMIRQGAAPGRSTYYCPGCQRRDA